MNPVIQPHTKIFLLTSIITLYGCITPTYIPYDNSLQVPKDENFEVKVYNQEQLNSDEYKIIGEISVEGCSCEIEKMSVCCTRNVTLLKRQTTAGRRPLPF